MWTHAKLQKQIIRAGALTELRWNIKKRSLTLLSCVNFPLIVHLLLLLINDVILTQQIIIVV